MRLTLEDVLKATGGDLTSPVPSSLTISGVSTDTRTLRPGDLFVPLHGPRADGNDFIPEAFRKGAAATLATRSENGVHGGPVIRVPDGLRALGALARYYRRTLTVTVVGITGSVGKTTTTTMCAGVLATRFAVLRTKDDWNAEIGVPLTVLGLEPDHQVAVIEMAMRGMGQIADLVEIAQPKVGVVTNVGDTHLELLGSRENIARAKEELIRGLPRGGTAVLNLDDPFVARMRPGKGVTVLTYGLDTAASIRAEKIVHDSSGVQFTLSVEGSVVHARLSTWGHHNVMNALAAAGVGVALGLDLRDIARGLETFVPPKMRLQPVALGDVLIINDAYNASPSSMEAAFQVLGDVAGRRRAVAVLGEMKELGADSGRLHHEVGRSVARRRRVALLVTVEQGGNQIAEGAAAGGMPAEAIIRIPSVEAAIIRVPALIRPNDVVLVKGSRALEMERVVSALVRARST
ncbi:MAG: UDP-N-acetylmuramoyl-tripeptide--D-alanyl-D-alanine ligase [Dehalococcoidia bacterium]|nr:UDP-N-acetylmuramoyl-tripeptide--D-alanyl-D-alanine ligase [Dehalococcoidia bacterium]